MSAAVDHFHQLRVPCPRGDAAPARPSKLPRDPFAGKGGRSPSEGDGGKIPVSRADLKDGDFMERNAALLRSGNFEVVD